MATSEMRARQDAVFTRALADFRRMYAGRRIQASDIVCSDESGLEGMRVDVVLEIEDDISGIDRWTEEDHMDPWFFVSLVTGSLPAGWHVVAVCGPSYHLDGTVDAPTGWRLVAPEDCNTAPAATDLPARSGNANEEVR